MNNFFAQITVRQDGQKKIECVSISSSERELTFNSKNQPTNTVAISVKPNRYLTTNKLSITHNFYPINSRR